MCIIEVKGYSKENKFIYCINCIIYKLLGNCQYLKSCEIEEEQKGLIVKRDKDATYKIISR